MELGKIRCIKPDLPQDEKVGKLSREARLLFIHLWSTMADDYGRIQGHTAIIKAKCYPYDSDVTGLQITNWLLELARQGMIECYQVDGEAYIQVVNFEEHQRIERHFHSDIPEPPSASRSASRKKGGKGDREKDMDMEKDRMERVWEAYCHSTSRRGSYILTKERAKKITKAFEAGYTEQDLLDAVEGWQYSPFHRGENKEGRVWNDLTLLLRDGEHIEKFRDLTRRARAIAARQNNVVTHPVMTQSEPSLLDQAEELRRVYGR